MEYIVAGYNMLTDIYYADGSTRENSPGGSFYSASGVVFWRDSVAYVGTAGPDFDTWYGDWFRSNEIECHVSKCLSHTLKYTLEYRPDGIWSEKCLYGDEYEAMAKDIGRITPEMFAPCVDSGTKGIYIEASLSARIADRFPEVKSLIPNGVLMWEINGDDLRDTACREAILARVAQVDAISMNLDEARGFFQTEDETVILSGIRAMGKPCFLRLGEKGAGFVTEEEIVFAPSIGTAESVDPTGCGNCSTAAAMIGLAEGLGLEKTAAMANLAAAYCARQNGPWPKADDETQKKAQAELAEYMAHTEFVYGRLL